MFYRSARLRVYCLDTYHVEHDTLAGGAVGLSTGNSPIYSQFLLSKPLHYPHNLNQTIGRLIGRSHSL